MQPLQQAGAANRIRVLKQLHCSFGHRIHYI